MDSPIPQLLGSIEADRLVILAGAGLSRAVPSLVPTASELASTCYREYARITGESLPASTEHDLEHLVDALRVRGQFEFFVDKLVPWQTFRTPANRGHDAIADFICTRVVDAVLTTNYDTLVEHASLQWGDRDLVPAVSDSEANENRRYAPYIKVHGCCHRERNQTVWSRRQVVDEAPVAARLERLAAWAATRLMGRDLLIVGFWSDWAYLNEVLAKVLDNAEPRRVVVVDLDETNSLIARAPELWTVISRLGPPIHVRASGADFLDGLRRQYGRQFVKRLVDQAKSELSLDQLTDIVGLDDSLDLPAEVFVSLRRFLCGIPGGEALRDKRPADHTLPAGIALVKLAKAGAVLAGKHLVNGERTFTIVAAHGRPVARVRKLFEGDFTSLGTNDVIVCAGATPDGGSPSDLVRSGGEGNVVRPVGQPMWLTSEEAVSLIAPVGDNAA